MARAFSAQDARQIISKIDGIVDGLVSIEAFSQRLQGDVRDAATALVNGEILKILQDIPVDELNREKRGLRIKLLRDSGYETVADIARATPRKIAEINGIGDDMAFTIRRLADNYIKEAGKSVKVRLSADTKTTEASQVVSAIYRYRESKPYIEQCRNLLRTQTNNISLAREDLIVGTGTLKWWLASSHAKQNAQNAYHFLSELAFGEFGQSAERNILALRNIHEAASERAWDDFSRNSIQYITELEALVPGILSSENEQYGLPEELAKSVSDVNYSLDGLKCTLRHYQVWGLKYILRQERVLLGDEMGLGKTVQAIAAMVALRNGGGTHFVVVCPASVLTNWCRELEKHSTLPVVRVYGPTRDQELERWLSEGGVAVTTYGTTAFFRLPEGFSPALFVVDEAHYIKNPTANRSRNVKAICGHSGRILLMTGTAMENRVDEMLELIQILRPQIAKDAEKIAFMASAPQFRAVVAPVYYRRRRDEVLAELPELIESREWCNLLPEEMAAYEQAILHGTQADARRVSWNVGDLERSSKARRMLEIIEEAQGEGRKVLVFSFYLDTLRSICELLGDRCLNPIHGAVTPQRRQEIIDEFDRAAPGTVLVSQIQSGGTGLNIQSASVVIICEPQVKPSTETQAISRAYRMGQTRNVLVYRLLCDDTIDEKLTDVMDSKQAAFDAFADKSDAAREDFELNAATIDAIIKEEAERIKAKQGLPAPQEETASEAIETEEGDTAEDRNETDDA